MTILEEATKGTITDETLHIAKVEKLDKELILKGISKGEIVIMKRKGVNPLGIGFPLRTKINVNLGTSSSAIDIEKEMEKVKIAEKYKADTLSDLSMGGDIDSLRAEIIKNSSVPITTVPI